MNTFSSGHEQQDFEMKAPVERNNRLLILFATVTGNAERIAQRLALQTEQCGFSPRVMDMAHCTPEILTQQRTVLIVASTFGDGEPPEDAASFWQTMVCGKGPDLRGVEFSVLALGNLTYDHFCRCGRDFDAALERHGATRLYPRIDCDAEYQQPAKRWMDGVTETLQRRSAIDSCTEGRHSKPHPDAAAPKREQCGNVFAGARAVAPGAAPIN
jgi:sulfite reductase (NADPH) flavoprotein alpha-component